MKRVLLAAALAATMATPATARGKVAAPVVSCDSVVRAGWDRMPDVADYIKTLPGSEKLGFGSECHLGSLVFAECFVNRRKSVKQAIDDLLAKARGRNCLIHPCAGHNG
jgi:hypothetical protein